MTSPLTIRRRAGVAALAAVLAGALALSACSSNDSSSASEVSGTSAPAGAAQDAWPRDVEIDGSTVSIPAAPQRIAALSTETGDLALALVGHERVVAVANGSVTPGIGNQVDEAKQVELALPRGTTPDPEKILSVKPDLVVMTGRHEGEEKAEGILRNAGIPILSFATADFASPDAVLATLGTLGRALGAEQKADEITKRMTSDRDQVLGAVKGDKIDTKVLLLMARGGKQFIQASDSTMSDLVTLAGGTVVGASGRAVPADPELIVKANPDLILVEDFQGGGLKPFTALLDNPALAQVPTIAHKQVHTVSASTASATSGTRMIEGLANIADILHPTVAPKPSELIGAAPAK